MKATSLSVTGLLLVAIGGCNASAANNAPASEAEIARYQELTTEVQSATVDYHSQMMGQAAMDATMCEYIRDQYYDRASPWVDEMQQKALEMDSTVHLYGGRNADYACVSQNLAEEFDHHHAVACTSSSLSENLAEVQRHVDAMTSYAAHLEDRCTDVMSAVTGATPDWGPMMASCEARSDNDECDAVPDGMMHGGMMGNGMMGDEDCD